MLRSQAAPTAAARCAWALLRLPPSQKQGASPVTRRSSKPPPSLPPPSLLQVERTQVVMGISFTYSPPPRAAVPYAAALRAPHER